MDDEACAAVNGGLRGLDQASDAWGDLDKHGSVLLFRTGRLTEDLSGDRHVAQTKQKEWRRQCPRMRGRSVAGPDRISMR